MNRLVKSKEINPGIPELLFLIKPETLKPSVMQGTAKKPLL
jgi:hypothetical protein